jgi:uncharacterized membrane protein YfcA
VFDSAALIASALIVGIAKAGFGAGVGVLAVPLMVIAIGAERMLGVLLPVLILGDLLSMIHYPGVFDRRNAAMILPGCALGVAIGSFILEWFRSLPDGGRYLGGAIGILCVLFVTVQAATMVVRMRRASAGGAAAEGAPYRPALWHGVLVGCAAGLASTLSHAAGPIVALFLLPQRLDQRVYVGTTLVYFLFGNLLKLGPFIWQGLITRDTLSYLLYLGPLVFVGTLAGKWMNRRLPARAFSMIIYALAFTTGVKLVVGLFTG